MCSDEDEDDRSYLDEYENDPDPAVRLSVPFLRAVPAPTYENEPSSEGEYRCIWVGEKYKLEVDFYPCGLVKWFLQRINDPRPWHEIWNKGMNGKFHIPVLGRGEPCRCGAPPSDRKHLH